MGDQGADDRDGQRIERSEEEWRQLLPADSFAVTRRAGTEPPFRNRYFAHHETGSYVCLGCSLPLFDATAKFDSGTGWPSFVAPVDKTHVDAHTDVSHGMVRTEARCVRCDAHLGHVFPDGPAPTGQRYCMNSAALRFLADPAITATFGAGCFWGVEQAFRQTAAITDTVVGYMGGRTLRPTYDEVCHGDTDHAEVVQVTFDPTKTSFQDIVQRFLTIHDPTQKNRQGPDVGSQYRSVIFTNSDEQTRIARECIERANASGMHDRPIATQVTQVATDLAGITAAGTFWRAEEEHQRYFDKNPDPGCHAPLPS